MSAQFSMRPRDYLGDHTSKLTLNLALFKVVAPKYDMITKALSMGRDGAWKRDLVNALPAHPDPVCVDLACGTGDITRLVATRYPNGHATGLDLTAAMLVLAQKRLPTLNIEYKEGSMHELPFDTASTDIVTGSYALRNAPDLNRTLDEISRVLKPGGIAAFLDFSKPASRLGQRLGYIMLKLWGGLWGLLFHGNPDVYGYIADSLQYFPDRLALRKAFEERGFTLRRSRRF
jgi:ubiquinone/menaquinone biosynthesis methyltransferase